MIIPQNVKWPDMTYIKTVIQTVKQALKLHMMEGTVYIVFALKETVSTRSTGHGIGVLVLD